MATKYRLIYFNVTGLAEPIRYLFAYGNIPFDDCRVSYEEWLKIKPGTPFGQIPVLEINGKPYNQTLAICRFLARKLNLMGKTDWDALQTDVVVDNITDFRLNYAAYFKEESDSGREKILKEIKENHNPFYLNRFETIVKENKGYFVNNQLTWADIFFSGLSDLWIKVAEEPILDKYSNLKSLKDRVESNPDIKAYRDRRPDTLY